MKHPLSSADISIYSMEISKFCYIKNLLYRLLYILIYQFCYIDCIITDVSNLLSRLHFYTSFQILLTFPETLKFFNKAGYNFDDVSKNGYPRPS